MLNLSVKGSLTAAVALRAAGTIAGSGADMLLPHIQVPLSLAFNKRNSSL